MLTPNLDPQHSRCPDPECQRPHHRLELPPDTEADRRARRAARVANLAALLERERLARGRLS